jgi:hypothetical protein
VTNALAVDLVRLLAVGIIVFYVVLPVWATREGIAWGMKRGAVAIIGASVVHQVAIAKGVQPGPAILLALACGWVAAQLVPARSRYIPTRIKRQVIAEYESKTGKRYKPREVEVDHVWPFARGGSHTADNLRVISKVTNRRKGAKKPGVRDWL